MELMRTKTKDSEGLLDLDLVLRLLSLGAHELHELVDVDGSAAVRVDHLDAFLRLFVVQLVPQHLHYGSELGGGDLTLATGVELLEGILEVGGLVVGQLEGVFLLRARNRNE